MSGHPELETKVAHPLQNGSTSPSQVVQLLLLVQESKQIIGPCTWLEKSQILG